MDLLGECFHFLQKFHLDHFLRLIHQDFLDLQDHHQNLHFHHQQTKALKH
tara:strand:+ start:437 stop:586 length:150 start_codon:yes stop_codon:yes gene_type:complete